jgi:hypothetical protein
MNEPSFLRMKCQVIDGHVVTLTTREPGMSDAPTRSSLVIPQNFEQETYT